MDNQKNDNKQDQLLTEKLVKDGSTTEEGKSIGKTTIPRVAFELSKIASNPKQGIAILVIGALILVYIIYGMFADDKAEKVKENPVEIIQKPNIVVTPSKEIDTSDLSVPDLPKAPNIQDPISPGNNVLLKNMSMPKIDGANTSNNEPPKLVELKTPEPNNALRLPKPITDPTPAPDPAPPPVAIDDNDSNNDVNLPLNNLPAATLTPEEQKKKDVKYKASIMLISGQVPKTKEEVEQNLIFTKRSNLEFLLGRGKLIDAVIETAISTDFPSPIRAIISRDVYSESGKVILIPKGSRIFGISTSSADPIYARVNITWDRIDLPSGYTVTFSGDTVDNLGKKGTQGRLDPKTKETFSNIILTTALNVLFSDAVNQIVKPQVIGASATAQQTQAANLQSGITAAFNNPDNATDPAKISAMCSAAINAITDPTNPIYTQVRTICTTAQATGTTTAANVQAQLNALVATANITSAAAATPTAAQTAASSGITEFGTALENAVKQSSQQPTVTLGQGTQIRILVNKDYLFPKEAVSTLKVLH